MKKSVLLRKIFFVVLAMLALALGFSVFGLSSVLGGSGFLAIYLAGLMIGTQPGRHLNFILPVHDGLADNP